MYSVVTIHLIYTNQHQLLLELCSTQTPDKSDPVLRLRIHSNTYDANGFPIFSIIIIHASDAFGPSLDLYCQQRGKRYGIDWKMVYCYAAPTVEKPHRQKYFDLTYNMKPVLARDKEYPGAAMRDGDTIFVVSRRTAVANEDDAGPQIECQRIHIQNGETEIWQSRSVNEAWYRDAEKRLTAARIQFGRSHDAVAHQRQVQTQLETKIAGLETTNEYLRQQVETMRQSQRAQTHGTQHQRLPDQQSYMYPDGIGSRQYLTRNEGSLQHGLASDYLSQRTSSPDYAPGSVGYHLRAHGYPVPPIVRRYDPVHDAGAKLVAEEVKE
jgi:hypothetical protein